MNTIELLIRNYRDGIRFPYPADKDSLNQLKTRPILTMRSNMAVFESPALYENGDRLFLTASRISGVVMIQLKTRAELDCR
jgi:hypothetical protein